MGLLARGRISHCSHQLNINCPLRPTCKAPNPRMSIPIRTSTSSLSSAWISSPSNGPNTCVLPEIVHGAPGVALIMKPTLNRNRFVSLTSEADTRLRRARGTKPTAAATLCETQVTWAPVSKSALKAVRLIADCRHASVSYHAREWKRHDEHAMINSIAWVKATRQARHEIGTRG
jgi:hypothetical protein